MPSSVQRPSAAAHNSARPAHRSGGSGRPSGSGRPAGASRSTYRPRKDRPVRTRPAAAPGPFDNLPLTVLDEHNVPSFTDLGLPKVLTQALARNGIDAPFPIQAATIADALTGRDVLGRASTGAGKTLAFGLPMIARLSGASSSPRRPRGLVLVPTRELAMQVTDALAPLAQACGLSVRLVAGGLAISKQITGMVRGTDIVVATPGRLADLIERRACDLSSVSITVLDEADHMADLGFLPAVRALLNDTPADGQRLLFSATLDGDVATLVTEYLTDPAIKALAPATASVDTMDHHVFRVPMELKWPLVHQIAARDGRTILFVRTKHGAERLARNLNRAGVAAGALHGGRTQGQRTKALSRFKDGSVPALVATDVAARGIHIDDVSLVLHVDPPADDKDYLHRSGRTARAGESGMVVTVVTPGEERSVRNLLSAAGVQPQQRDAHPGDEDMLALTGGREPSGVPVVEAASRPERSPRPDRSARPNRSARPDRAGRPDRSARPDRSRRTDGPRWDNRGERPDASARSQRPERRSSSPKRHSTGR